MDVFERGYIEYFFAAKFWICKGLVQVSYLFQSAYVIAVLCETGNRSLHDCCSAFFAVTPSLDST